MAFCFAVDLKGWVRPAEHCPSPNFNMRPAGEISLLVIHAISLPPEASRLADIKALFLNTLDHQAHPDYASLKGVEVSSHFVIGREGELIQFVSCLDRAWHAGVSNFKGRENCNDFAIGIELEGPESAGFTQDQYDTLIHLTEALFNAYPGLDRTRIVGHCHIAPDRKTDPGPQFDWDHYLGAI